MSDEVRDLQQRVSWLERQFRMLLVELKYDGIASRNAAICVNSQCQNGPVPHMAEQPYGCPRLVSA